MTIVLSLINTYLIFILFSLIISLFGGIFIYVFQNYKKERWNLTLFEYIFISYAIGILTYIIIAYFLNIFKLFNFFTAYFPFLIISTGFLLYLFKKKKIQHILTRIRQYINFNYKNIILYSVILVIIYLFQFLTLWSEIFKSNSLFSRDPYYWTSQILYLNKNGAINYSDNSSTYPWGFVFFCGGNLLISNNFTATYYFMKFACFPFLNFYILVMFSISRKIFKKHTLVFSSSFLILAQIFFIFRSMMFLPSSVSILLILISLLIILTKVPNYFLSIIISGTFLFNPVYSFFFIIIVLIFYSTKFIFSKLGKPLILKEAFILGFFSIIFIIPYLVNVYFFYGLNLVSLFKKFSSLFEISNFNESLTIINILPNLGFVSFLLSLFNISITNGELNLYIVFILIIPSFGLVFYKGFKGRGYKDFLIFVKIGFLFTIFVLLSPLFLNKIMFFKEYYIRVLEAFIPYLIILFGIFCEYVIIESNKLWHYMKFKYRKIKDWSEKNEFNRKVLNIPFIIVILILLSSFLAYNYSRTHIVTHYYYDDSLVDCAFYINNNIDEGSNVAVYFYNDSSLHPSAIYYLLYNYNLFYYQFDTNLTLVDFWDFLNNNSIAFFIINLNLYNQDFMNDVNSNNSINKLIGGQKTTDFSLYVVIY
ncbi:MAG: hypothetical protein ACFFDH_06985 [Promethearchaeota archaeon]